MVCEDHYLVGSCQRKAEDSRSRVARGGKSAATWQPSCQKVFEESGSGRKFLDPSPVLYRD